MDFETPGNRIVCPSLAYAGKAECYTDNCKAVDERLKQRSRKVNSEFTCRSWSLVNFAGCLRDSGSPVSGKLRVSTAVVSMLWSHTLAYFQPLLTILLLYTSYLSSQILFVRGALSGTHSALAFSAIVVLWLTPTAIVHFNEFKKIKPATSKIPLMAVVVSAIVAIKN